MTSESHDVLRPGTERPTGHLFSMAEFERRIAADPDVLGMVYTGSQGRGGGDRYSDLDIKLWIRDEVLETPGLLERYLGWLGDLHFVMSFGLFGNALIGPDWQSADLGLIGAAHLEPGPYYHRATIVKDTDGQMAKLVADSWPPTPELTSESAQKVIEELIHMLSEITRYNNRGSFFSAMGLIVEQAINVYGLLARLRGLEPYDARFTQRFLPPDECALLYATWPARPEREEIRRSGRALWDWGKYVWDEADRTIGVSLDIPLDEAGMLSALERIYTWEQ